MFFPLFLTVKVTSFSRLCSSLDYNEENQQQDVLKCIQQVAELVQGNWVVKSDVLYPVPEKERDKTVKLCGLTGIHPEILAKARDFVVIKKFYICVNVMFNQPVLEFLHSCKNLRVTVLYIEGLLPRQ